MLDELKAREPELIEAYSKARKSLVPFRFILLSVGEEEVEPAEFHYKWSDDLLFGEGNEAKQGFRESGKSQYVLRACPLYCLTFPEAKRDYIVIIKKNATLARNKLKEIENEYISNPAINTNLIKVNEQSGDVFDVDVRNANGKTINVRIEAYGKGASIRGLSTRDRRPKIVIIDDPQDIEDAKSETVQATDWTWFLSDVMFLGQNTRIFLIGNNLGDKCIIERVFANAESLGFKVERIPTVDSKGKSTWPSKYTIEDIEKSKESYRRLGKIDIWMREKMCQSVSDELRVFHKEDYRYFVSHTARRIAQDNNIFFTIDPASSVDKTACFRAIVINVVNEKNQWFIVDVPFGRWDSAELMNVLFENVKLWNPMAVGIEKGMFKQVIEPFIMAEMSRRNIFFDIQPIEHAKVGSKLERVKMLAPRFKAHTIHFPDVAPWLSEMEAELNGVTKDGFKSLFTDLVDALAMQFQIVTTPFNSESEDSTLPRYAMKEDTSNIFDKRLPREAEVQTII